MIDLADYIAHLVDGRSTGVLAADAQTYSQVLGLATALKAAVQWFRLDASSRPKFIAEAERYLAEQSIGQAIVGTRAVEPNDRPISIRSDPVAARKGGRGVAGRQEAVVRLKEAISRLLSKVSRQSCTRTSSRFKIHLHLSLLKAGSSLGGSQTR